MTVHSPVCVIHESATQVGLTLLFRRIYTLLLSCISSCNSCYVCTVTCRQFPNLTFAPRKTRLSTATSRFFAINVTANMSIYEVPQMCNSFFLFFSQIFVFIFVQSHDFTLHCFFYINSTPKATYWLKFLLSIYPLSSIYNNA